MPEFKINLPDPDPNDEELQVAPVEAESAAEVLARLERWERLLQQDSDDENEGPDPPPNEFKYSLKQMLLVVTVLSVWLGVLRALSALKLPVVSGLTGIAALVGMFWISSQEDQPRILRVIWWGMLLVYATCSIATWIAG